MRPTLALLIAILFWPFDALAQVWPQRPVTLIVSQSAGASPDVMARMITNKLSVILGQSFLVETNPVQAM